MIDTWEKEYENAFRIFKSELKKEKTKVSEIKNSLFQCSPQTYEIFCRIYPMVSNGAEFNPFQNTDTVKMYEKVGLPLPNFQVQKFMYKEIYLLLKKYKPGNY